MRFKWEAARVECFCMRESPVGGKILEYFKFLLKSISYYFRALRGLCHWYAVLLCPVKGK